ncbi:molybdopterin-dependent oxidoreductase [Haloplanus pelagicus]|jgi:DMSO/TMAO reductase YedYZ molybdopterin-dependent catalytic subunit|uniref:molybdopterin-dependent oxidoreductase n=1 Tax=Haloplanus pelagicus TaxID=2949995 RepID=UPI002041F431|nr:molybdopterin-dependent oxidoreductase [Haloplanus sp. HW8-1]
MAGSEPAVGADWSVAVDGVGVVDPTGAPRGTVSASFRCASGERWTGEWRGVPVEWILDRLQSDSAATHLRIHGPADHVACVALADAVGGVLAESRLDGPARAGGDGWPRFVAPRVVGARTVKRVPRLEPVALGAGEDVDAYETLDTG